MAEDDFINLRKEAIASAFERFNTVSPMLNVIITGHSMIEEEINKLIKTLARFPDEAEKLDINFPKRVRLIRAFLPVDPGSNFWANFWTLLLSFNQFRNDFAHNHDDEIKEKHLSEICENLSRLSKKTREFSDDVALVRQSCAVCVGVLTASNARSGDLPGSRRREKPFACEKGHLGI